MSIQDSLPRSSASSVQDGPSRGSASSTQDSPPGGFALSIKGSLPRRFALSIPGWPPTEFASSSQGSPPNELASSIQGSPPRESASSNDGSSPREFASLVQEGPPRGFGAKLLRVLPVCVGNCLAEFDFFLFGFYAPYIAEAFFPSKSQFASLMMTFGVFGAGFLIRPVGAVVLGAYIDKVGRRQGLLAALSFMAAGTLLIGLVPGYKTIGFVATIVVVLGRLLQGFAAGAGLGGVSVYLSEIATPGHMGFYTAWQACSTQVAIMTAATIGFILSVTMSEKTIQDWAWRIPFIFGCLMIPVLVLLRGTLVETEAFKERTKHPGIRENVRTLRCNSDAILNGWLLVSITTTAFYLTAVYAPTFGKTVLLLSARDSLLATFLVAVSNFFWLPIGGAISDSWGRRPVLLTMTVLGTVSAYPALWILCRWPSFFMMVSVLCWLSFIYGAYTGAMLPTLTEIMPEDAKVTGFSLAYSLAAINFGGSTPLMSTALIELTHDKASPAFWMIYAAVCAFFAIPSLDAEIPKGSELEEDVGTSAESHEEIDTLLVHKCVQTEEMV